MRKKEAMHSTYVNFSKLYNPTIQHSAKIIKNCLGKTTSVITINFSPTTKPNCSIVQALNKWTLTSSHVPIYAN